MRLRLVLAVAGAVVAAAVPGAWLLLSPAPALEHGARVVEIPASQGVRGVADHLHEAGVIRSRAVFVAASLARGSARRLRAGEYEVPRGASTLDVLALLESGRVRQHVLLHPEGATVAELARALEAARLARADDVLRAARDPRLLAALGVEADSLEGYLFPDTYHFVRGLAAEEILRRMVQQLRARLGPEVTARAAARGLSLHQLLTLASIVEREGVARDELGLIAAVFWNRLRRDMPLQADPTVQYAAGKERRALTRADLEADHPYNTYRRPGLPPGPIASPGAAAIAAVLDPAPVRYLYFVSIDERRHHFSATLEEHNAAVARWRARAAERR
jgi:UPF0755 protein